MFRRTFLMLQVLTPLALCTAVVAAPPAGSKPPVGAKPPVGTKLDPKKLMEEIRKNAKLAGTNYWHVAEVRHPGKKRTVATAPFQKPKAGNGPMALAVNNRSSLTVVGGEDVPAGFGKGFTWDRSQDEALLVMFINAADPLGVSIDGLQAGDQIQVLSASGIASFSQDKGNPLASSIVGLVAAGANVAITAAGYPEVVPVINAAESFAKDQFKATGSKRELRDTFGVAPGSGLKARQEGGVLVCMPEAGGTFYSGDNDHKARWIQGTGDRTDDKLPAHMFGSFFPRQGFGEHNTRTAQQTGPMYLVPWDWQFDDNAGFYKVFVKLKKGNGLPPIIIERKSTTPVKPTPKG
jgi:hypothetical protein